MAASEHALASPRPTVGILFPGELGSTLARVLMARGLRVVTTLAGRSERTAGLCRAAGLEVLDSIGEVVTHADVLLSVVTPSAAASVAQRVVSESAERRGRTLYVDVNSISPVTVANIGHILDRPGFELVDASIHGLASRLIGNGTLYVSGPAAAEVVALFGGSPRTVLLGDQLGRASLLKMLVGGVSKGLVALMLELSEVALEGAMLDEFWEVCQTAYPGVMEPFERLLPTYPVHASRRAEEMAELELTVSAAGQQPVMPTAVRTVLEQASQSTLDWAAILDHLTATGNRVLPTANPETDDCSP